MDWIGVTVLARLHMPLGKERKHRISGNILWLVLRCGQKSVQKVTARRKGGKNRKQKQEKRETLS